MGAGHPATTVASVDRSAIAETLATVTRELPGGGEARPGQVQMAEAVASAIDDGRHLVVQAGTGTGKSLAYLVPAVASDRTVVVATATTRRYRTSWPGRTCPSWPNTSTDRSPSPC